MGFDGALGDPSARPICLWRFPCWPAQDLTLAVAELVGERGRLPLRQKSSGDARIERHTPGARRTDGGQQIGGLAVLEQIADRTASSISATFGWSTNDVRATILTSGWTARICRVASIHRDGIERSIEITSGERAFACSTACCPSDGFTDDVDIGSGREQPHQPGTYQPVIVSKQHGGHRTGISIRSRAPHHGTRRACLRPRW